MLFPQSLRRGRLVRRYKRFLADVVFDSPSGEGQETTVHVANPGAMFGLAEPGVSVWCSLSPSKTRKLPFSWELVEVGAGLVDVNTSRPNRLVAEALETGAIPELAGYTSIRAEVAYGERSRVDFLLEHPDRPPCWVEVKGVTLSRTPGLAEWPDCVSARGAKHMAELEARLEAGDRAVVLFVVQRTDCDRFAVAADLDPTYAKAAQQAFSHGVEELCYETTIDLRAMRLTRRLPWQTRQERAAHGQDGPTT
jgi:sugar fermentation stimulation protein A